MKRLLDSDLDLVVASGFIYLPLLFDPEIEKETRVLFQPEKPEKSFSPSESETIIKLKDRYFVKAFSVNSLIENYEAIDAYSYQRLRNACLQKYHLIPEIYTISADSKLRTILFRIMPYFIKINKGLERRSLSETEILDLIAAKINIPKMYYEAAKTFLDTKFLPRILKDLEEKKPIIEPPNNGLLPARELRKWFFKALDEKILESESERLKQTLQIRKQLIGNTERSIAVLLYIAQNGSLEIDGFGFSRIGSRDEYCVYKRTGEYILKDYYARRYLFPDCRVAVPTNGPFKPFVVDRYKHPFLFGQDSGQTICLRRFNAPKQFTVDNIIKTLENGINTLLYGYDSRRRNGQHSLDRTRVYVRTIEFDDYRI